MLTRTRLVIATLCILYVALRLWRLDDSCLWFDEIFSVHAAEHDWGSLFSFVAKDLIHPPLFYLVLKVWISVGGDSVFWLRLLPVLISCAALVPLINVCRELKLESSATVIALVSIAVNGALIKYAQEVRMYSLLFLLSTLSFWLFSRFYFRGKNIWLLTIVNILLVYTHYFGWFVVAAEVVTIFLFQRVKIRHVLIMAGIALLTFAPWAIAVARAASAGADVTENIGWMSRPGLRGFVDFLFDLAEPFYFQQSSAEPSSILYITLPLLVLIGIAKVLFFINFKEHTERNGFYLLYLFAAVPVALTFAISWIAPISIWGSRHLIIVFVPIALMIAMFIASLNRTWLRVGLLSGSAALIVAAFVVQITRAERRFVWCQFEEAGRDIEKTGQGPIYVFEDLAAYHLWFTFRGSRDKKEWMQVAKVTGFPGMTEDKAYFLPRGTDDVLRITPGQLPSEQMWIVYRARTWNPASPPLDRLTHDFDIVDLKTYDADSQKVFAVFLEKKP